jgi:hypothetical protein
MRRQYWAALMGGGISGALAVLTLISREWIEFIFGVDPDHGNGGLEWAIVAVTAITAVACFWWARVEYKRSQPGGLADHG